MNVNATLKNIKIFLSDVDGVMTDTRIFLNSDGEWCRHFSIYDGMGLKRLQEHGIKTGIITAALANDVRKRFEFLKVDYFCEGSKDKIKDLKSILSQTDFHPKEVCYIGDDLMDLPVIKEVGFGVTVPHALDEIKEGADYVTKHHGGFGAVREICELIIQAHQKSDSNEEGVTA
jgi:3-deoxy-D-manno-octulosonate 8-phosphate phosphatase (KDO 8-P phosphatase)